MSAVEERRERQVRELFAAFARGREAGCDAVRAAFSAGCVWTSAGMPATTGPDEAIALIERYESELGIARTDLEIVHLAARGDLVLVEHLDRAWRADGSLVLEMEACGVLEFDGDAIVAWREYFDPNAVSVAPDPSATAA